MGEVNNSGSKLSHTMISSSSCRVLCLQEQQHSLGKRGTELALEALKAIPSVYSEMITFLLFLVTSHDTFRSGLITYNQCFGKAWPPARLKISLHDRFKHS